MAQAARAYPRERERYQEKPRAQVRVIDGRGKDARRKQSASPVLVTVCKAAIVLILFLAAVCLLRVWFTASTVSSMIQEEELDTNIEIAREYGSDLEVEQTMLTNGDTVKNRATELGLSASAGSQYFDIGTILTVQDAATDIELPQSVTSSQGIGIALGR